MKKRTLNELRQVKDSFYDTKKAKTIKDYYRKVNFDPQHVVDLIKQYPNDKDLGTELRKYYQHLIKKI